MKRFFIEKEKNTPRIELDPDGGRFDISGKSFPENSKKFYQPVLEWFDEFVKQAAGPIEFNFEFYYISSSSIISILELIKKIDAIAAQGVEVSVTWKYDEDDDDIRKIGEDYAKLTHVNFNVAVNE